MSVEHTAVVSPITSTWTSTDAPRLHGRWLFLVRAAWVAVAALAIGISVAGMPYEMSILRRVCTAGGDACLEYLTPDMVQVLWELGLPASFYAWYATVAGLIFASVWIAVALIIFTRRSDNPIALLVALWLVIFGTFFSERPAALLAAHPAWWLPIQFVRFLTGTCLFLCCYLFPDGRFVPHWTRWVALVIGVQMAANFLFPESPLAPGHWLPEMVGLPAFVGLLSSLLFAQVYRYRYISTPVQRQQTKWVVFGIGTTLLAFMSLIFVPRICFPSLFQPGRAAGVFGFAFLPLLYMSLLPLPLSLGIALLRGRLWDIDILINRTLVYATLTACIVGAYILIVGVLGAVLQTHGNLLVSLVATGVVAVLFHPLRERLQRTVNRLMYGERDDPYQVISRLGRRLEATLEPGTVLPRVVETVKEALKLPYVAVRLKHDDRLGPAASAGIAPPDLVRLPLVYAAETIGELVLAPRAPGESFSSADHRLLNDLARQAGVAAHAVLLTADLEHSRMRIVTEREEARRRLGSDLHDGLGHRLAGLLRKAETAMNVLDRDPVQAKTYLREIGEQVRVAINEVRSLAHTLHPPELDLLGLVGALQERVQQCAESGNNGVRITVDTPASLPPLPAALEVAVYYIAQEALTNMERHAGARRCHLRLALVARTDIDSRVLATPNVPVLELEVTDDGQGLPATERSRGGLGLASMRERAAEVGGSCVIEPITTGGTRVYARLPCPTLVERIEAV